MKHTMNASRGAGLYGRLAVVAAAGLTVVGCADGNAPGAPSTAPSPPAVSATPLPAAPQQAILDWAKSTCQTLKPAFDPLDAPPQLDLGNLTATRQAYITYLGTARTAAQQAIDRLPAIGAPPVDNGQQVLDSMREQLTDLREDLDDAVAQLNQADPTDVIATGLALGAAGNILGAFGNRVQVLSKLIIDPKLRAAAKETPECRSLVGANATSTTKPTGSSQPTR